MAAHYGGGEGEAGGGAEAGEGEAEAEGGGELGALEPLGSKGVLADDEGLAAHAEEEAAGKDGGQALEADAGGDGELAREDEQAADGAPRADS
jgi:hypothetical protein